MNSGSEVHLSVDRSVTVLEWIVDDLTSLMVHRVFLVFEFVIFNKRREKDLSTKPFMTS